jgi:3',5'-cyclic-AMP phosphodiesterase
MMKISQITRVKLSAGIILFLVVFMLLPVVGRGSVALAVTEKDVEPMASFFVISDLHVTSGASESTNHLKQALADMESFGDKAQAIFITGDITDSATAADYRELQHVLSAYRLPPVYAIMGNHEYYSVWINEKGEWSKDTFPNGKTDVMSRQTFLSFFNLKKPYQAVRLNGVQIVLLSQETYLEEKPEVREGAWYSEEQMEWFRNEIARSKKGKPIFVMIHQELPSIGSDGGNHTLIKAKQFRDTLKKHPNVFVFSGHTHHDFTGSTQHYVKETFHWFRNSSIGQVLDERDQHVRKNAAQGMFVEVYADKVVLRGREFSDQSWIEDARWTVRLSNERG